MDFESQWVSDLGFEFALRGKQIQDDFATQEVIFIEMAVNRQAVGNRGLEIAAIEADRTRVSTGAFRSHHNAIGNRVNRQIQPGSTPNAVQHDTRQIESETRNFGLVVEIDGPIGNQAEVVARPTHVYGKYVLGTQKPGHELGAQDAAYGTRDQGLVQSRVADVGQPAIGQHSRHLFAVAALLGPILYIVQLPAYRVGRIRLDCGGVNALVFTDHRPNA